MASEDHDFLEVNHVNIYNNKYEWKTEERGMVGDFNTKQVNKLIDDIFSVLGKSEYSENLMERLRICYDNHSLSEATRFLVNELFGKYGIVILDEYGFHSWDESNGVDRFLKKLTLDKNYKLIKTGVEGPTLAIKKLTL